ncbi:DUF262 domain-containing protein [Pontibacter sp. FD36]|uniref:DUF262 domain-containing protein n=1 Tax=Pontibacter sp. FD36 TaxID=2789860 RepID=UPI0018A9E049|nr:DUF262 domain-containing protein [Pontibacter sp. FD36]MBF8965076.1 DUF262 domain-containing protein [Pontibacter sp. FD36]
MDKTLKAKEFRNIFQNSLKINARSMSIKTLLSERNLKRIDYSPYYQRNYVWDNTKQTFFIESVILGTEIPPLILFKTGQKIEVIDGRQRFETLKRFKENDFRLNVSGLKELKILHKSSFNKLSSENQEIFLNSNIRIYEFEVINHPNLDDQIIDTIKKEIFRRYNTGITPLTREELDNAKYDKDIFSELFKTKLKSDFNFLRAFNLCFFPKQELTEGANNKGLIAKNVDFIRRFRILNSFPISTYAGSERTEIIDLLYDFAKENTDDPQKEFEDFTQMLEKVFYIYNEFSEIPGLTNKLINECILWAFTILRKEDIDLKIDIEKFKAHYSENKSKYTEIESHYYKSIIERFSDTASFFEKLSKFKFNIYIKDEGFRKRIDDLKQTEVDAAKSIDELSILRLNKPNPISTPVDEIRDDLKTNKYLVRPSYQRQEKINEIKASSIIESILLGINLPPVFIYKRSNNIKEVVDGQQRLLAILGFLGNQYLNEDGKLISTKNNNFKLRGLRILTNLEGSNYSSLTLDLQDKILDFVLDFVIIEETVNPDFDPVDLFIRLNYKPYPIRNNSFEMWNSIVNQEVVKKIKDEVVEAHKDWFFLRERIIDKPDRMENEELITILSFISYSNLKQEKVIGFFPRQDRITCRLFNKKGLGDFLINLDNVAIEKNHFLDCIKKTNDLIIKFSHLFGKPVNKDILNEYLNVKNSKKFRRSLQDFYVIWLVLDKIPEDVLTPNNYEILNNIRELLSLLRNTSESDVNANYMQTFNHKLEELSNIYSI